MIAILLLMGAFRVTQVHDQNLEVSVRPSWRRLAASEFERHGISRQRPDSNRDEYSLVSIVWRQSIKTIYLGSEFQISQLVFAKSECCVHVPAGSVYISLLLKHDGKPKKELSVKISDSVGTSTLSLHPSSRVGNVSVFAYRKKGKSVIPILERPRMGFQVQGYISVMGSLIRIMNRLPYYLEVRFDQSGKSVGEVFSRVPGGQFVASHHGWFDSLSES